MATKEQVYYLHSVCPSGFLPPFEKSYWNGKLGLLQQNVEFWSGGKDLKCTFYASTFILFILTVWRHIFICPFHVCNEYLEI